MALDAVVLRLFTAPTVARDLLQVRGLRVDREELRRAAREGPPICAKKSDMVR